MTWGSELEHRLLAEAAAVHAATARMSATLAEFTATGEWEGHGIRSVGHWCDINLGLPSRLGNEVASMASRLGELPLLSAAFADGSLSLDKVRVAAAVATAESDEKFTSIAMAASVAQLQRICAAYRKLNEDESSEAEQRRRARRGVTKRDIDDGLVRITALLDADEAAIVFAAIDARVEDEWRKTSPAADEPNAVTCTPHLASRRADALVELAAEGMVAGPDPIVAGERVGVNVHIDAALLTGARVDGICEIEGIGAVTPATIERLLCDCHVKLMADGPFGSIDLGRSQRTINRRQRRALQHRDRGCRFPGCGASRYLHGHHVLPWEHGGPTDIDNLMLLCPAHHRLFHEGDYSIDAHGDGKFTFRTPDGRAIEPPPLRTGPDATPTASGVPRASDGGGRYDLGLTLDALLN
jgi:hypothetical protein